MNSRQQNEFDKSSISNKQIHKSEKPRSASDLSSKSELKGVKKNENEEQVLIVDDTVFNIKIL